MKNLAIILTAIALASCAEFEGNGVSVGFEYFDPDTGLKVDLHTAK